METKITGKIPGSLIGFEAESDPDLANRIADEIQSDDDTEPPKIAPPEESTVTLPAGLIQPDGSVARKVELKELTGADEETLAKGRSSKNISHFISTLIECSVVSVEGRHPDEFDLGNLVMGDRNFLVLHIRRITYGDEIQLSLRCPSCADSFEVLYSLTEDVPVRTLEDPKDRVFEVKLNHGRIAKVAMPTGHDQTAVTDADTKSSAEANTLLLAHCVREIDGMGPSTITEAVEVARELGLRDRRTILEAITEKQVGPRYEEVTQACPRCERTFPLVLDLLDLFRS